MAGVELTISLMKHTHIVAAEVQEAIWRRGAQNVETSIFTRIRGLFVVLAVTWEWNDQKCRVQRQWSLDQWRDWSADCQLWQQTQINAVLAEAAPYLLPDRSPNQ